MIAFGKNKKALKIFICFGLPKNTLILIPFLQNQDISIKIARACQYLYCFPKKDEIMR